MSCTIYLLKNNINGKVYIGQTWQNLNDRFNNGFGYIGCRHLYAAINKYGKDNFKYEILELCVTQEMADIREHFYIEKFNSTDRIYGYNLKIGGSNGKHSAETKMKMSIAHKGRRPCDLALQLSAEKRRGSKASAETRAKQSAAKKGKPSPHKGRIVPPEVGRKISLAKTGKKHTEEAKRNMGLSKIGQKRSDESKKRMSEARMGIVFSKEHLINLSKSHIGHKDSEETKAKKSKSLTGRVVSDATRMKISESNKKNKVPIERRNKIAESLREYYKNKKSCKQSAA